MISDKLFIEAADFGLSTLRKIRSVSSKEEWFIGPAKTDAEIVIDAIIVIGSLYYQTNRDKGFSSALAMLSQVNKRYGNITEATKWGVNTGHNVLIDIASYHEYPKPWLTCLTKLNEMPTNIGRGDLVIAPLSVGPIFLRAIHQKRKCGFDLAICSPDSSNSRVALPLEYFGTMGSINYSRIKRIIVLDDLVTVGGTVRPIAREIEQRFHRSDVLPKD